MGLESRQSWSRNNPPMWLVRSLCYSRCGRRRVQDFSLLTKHCNCIFTLPSRSSQSLICSTEHQHRSPVYYWIILQLSIWHWEHWLRWRISDCSDPNQYPLGRSAGCCKRCLNLGTKFNLWYEDKTFSAGPQKVLLTTQVGTLWQPVNNSKLRNSLGTKVARLQSTIDRTMKCKLCCVTGMRPSTVWTRPHYLWTLFSPSCLYQGILAGPRRDLIHCTFCLDKQEQQDLHIGDISWRLALLVSDRIPHRLGCGTAFQNCVCHVSPIWQWSSHMQSCHPVHLTRKIHRYSASYPHHYLLAYTTLKLQKSGNISTKVPPTPKVTDKHSTHSPESGLVFEGTGIKSVLTSCYLLIRIVFLVFSPMCIQHWKHEGMDTSRFCTVHIYHREKHWWHTGKRQWGNRLHHSSDVSSFCRWGAYWNTTNRSRMRISIAFDADERSACSSIWCPRKDSTLSVTSAHASRPMAATGRTCNARRDQVRIVTQNSIPADPQANVCQNYYAFEGVNCASAISILGFNECNHKVNSSLSAHLSSLLSGDSLADIQGREQRLSQNACLE